jgi:hypothetical protein
LSRYHQEDKKSGGSGGFVGVRERVPFDAGEEWVLEAITLGGQSLLLDPETMQVFKLEGEEGRRQSGRSKSKKPSKRSSKSRSKSRGEKKKEKKEKRSSTRSSSRRDRDGDRDDRRGKSKSKQKDSGGRSKSSRDRGRDRDRDGGRSKKSRGRSSSRSSSSSSSSGGSSDSSSFRSSSRSSSGSERDPEGWPVLVGRLTSGGRLIPHRPMLDLFDSLKAHCQTNRVKLETAGLSLPEGVRLFTLTILTVII